MQEIHSPVKGKIAAIVFILLLILPVCYALYKEMKYKKENSQTPKTTNAATMPQ
jgi:hypothetical protein